MWMKRGNILLLQKELALRGALAIAVLTFLINNVK
jgi:hypothetical protein